MTTSKVILNILIVGLVLVISNPVLAQSDQGLDARVFGQGQPQTVNELPPGQLKNKLKSLPPQARAKALKWLQDFSFPAADVESLHADDEGNIFYADSFTVEEADEGSSGPAAPQAAPATTLDDAFLLHSRPGAPNRVYIDFNGHVITGTAWNSGNGAAASYNAKPYDLDGNPSTFNTLERTRIVGIWHRIAEDMAPFDIDVTTEEPASFDRYTGRILVTHTMDSSNQNMPSNGGGGVAYVGVFGAANYHTYYSPALVYYDHLGGGSESSVAEASSHELGHNLALSHDGQSPGTAYYEGHGPGLVSWAPIMGVGYYKNVTQWSKGEYTNANQLQDDLDIIDGLLGYASDDHGDTLATASALAVEGDTVVSSNPEFDPHNVLPENKGIIGSGDDVDVFSFIAGAGTINLSITPAWDAFYAGTSNRGANLDILAELRNVSGALVTSSDPVTDTSATINANVNAGSYYLLITGTGNDTSTYSDYGSLGQYFINGTVPSALEDTTAPTPNPMAFASEPVAISPDAISMTAVTATDDITSVQYNFRCVAGGSGCVNSGWQSGTTYTATGLAANTSYTFTVEARDQSSNLNTTSPSGPQSTTTENPPPYVDYTSVSDTSVVGSVSGTHTATHSDDGSTQSITERQSGGKKQTRYTYLEHRWNFNVNPGETVEVFVQAWKTGSNSSESFDFDYSANGGSFQPLFNVSSGNSNNLQSFEIPGAPSGSIVIRVTDTFQQSGNTNESTIHVDHLYIRAGNPPSDPPYGEPSNMTAIAVSSSQINLTWLDGSTNESGFKVERSPGGEDNWSEIADLAANSESYNDMGLTASTTYDYRVKAYNDYGSSAFVEKSATTQAPPPAPDAPTDLAAIAVSTSQINLSWTDGGPNEENYRVERSPGDLNDWGMVTMLAANANSFSDSGLDDNSPYVYRVVAVNGVGEAISNVAGATTKPLPLLSLSASGYKDRGTHHVILEWTGGGNVDVYRDGEIVAPNRSATSYDDNTGAKGGATYVHKVCVVNDSTTCSNETTTVF